MASDGRGPGEVEAVTFGDGAIQPLGGGLFPHLTRVSPLRAPSGSVRARHALENVRRPVISSARSV